MTSKNLDYFLKITSVQQLMDPDIQKQEKIWIENILHTKIDLVPVNVKHLTIRSCNLLSLKGLVNVRCLEYLDVSGNPVYSMHEVVVHKQLKTLILQNTKIIEVSQVSQLLNLVEFDATNSFIVDSLPLIDHQNFDVKWLTPQQRATKAHFEMHAYLNNEYGEELTIINEQLDKKPVSEYTILMAKRYASQVNNGKLIIDNDQEVTHFAFTDYLRLESVSFNKCFNISFEQTPTHLKELSITNSALINIDGIQNMSSLQYLNLSNNNLLFIRPLLSIKTLQHVFIDNNHIHDLEILKQLPNFKFNVIGPQSAPQTEIYNKYFKHICSKEQLKELKATFENSSKHNLDFIQDTKYTSQFINQIQNNQLRIFENDLESIRFCSYLNVNELILTNCINISFGVVPNNIQKLTVNNCYLTTKKIIGIEKIHLRELNLGLNALTDDCLEIIKQLKEIERLDLSMNRLEKIDNISELKQLKSLDLNQNRIKQIDCLEQLTELENLDISFNQVSQIVKLENLVNIKVLNVSHNKINTIQCLAKMKNIVSLDISFNQIISVEICKTFELLTDLRTQKNKIQDLSTIMTHKNCQQSWSGEQNELEDQDYAYSGLSQRQITELKMGKKYNQNNNAMLKKYQDQMINSVLTINNDNEVMNLLFADVKKISKIRVENCENIVFDMAPVYVQVLAVRNSKLSHIENIYQMEQLTNLDLSGNAIRNISELGALTNIIRLNLSSNDIYRIDSLKELNKLQYLNLSNNKILFCEPIKDLSVKDLQLNDNFILNDLELVTKMKNMNQQLLQFCYKQSNAQLSDYQNYLGANDGTLDAAQKLMDQYQEQRNKMSVVAHDIAMNAIYKDKVKYNELLIENDQYIMNISFIDQLNIQKLTLINCCNLTFERFSLKVTDLTINNCNLYHVSGIEKMKQLTKLNLNNNKLIIVEHLGQLTNLKQLQVENNFIQDLNLVSVPGLKLDVGFQNEPTNEDYQFYLNQINSQKSVEEFTNSLTEKKKLTQQIVLKWYENKMKLKYQSKVRGGVLIIQNDPEVRDLSFMDLINVTNAQIISCYNVQFISIPTKLTHLTINKCELKEMRGIEKMTQIIALNVNQNKLVLIQSIFTPLVNLNAFSADFNYITDFDTIATLPHFQPRFVYYQHCEPQSEAQNQLLQSCLDAYDDYMVKKYYQFVKNKRLDIKSDLELKHISFADKFSTEGTPLQLEELNIDSCLNVNLLQVPTKITKLSIQRCELKRITGVERMKQLKGLSINNNLIQNIDEVKYLIELKELSATINKIVNIESLRELTGLETVDLQFNRIQDLSPLNSHANRKDKYYLGGQLAPTQQEIDDAK
ncbi:leucine-rich_repeat domain-containing protein [Hexamita inflata]|uniref:Leucine-rich repeat domain-containing protein n=1 Tax=Hexamita inflata TaxID=28002 RepID=A0AA86RG31_9EUKA|nr:leucine-rich repeat domain-containing protein [Hexamita inflata]